MTLAQLAMARKLCGVRAKSCQNSRQPEWDWGTETRRSRGVGSVLWKLPVLSPSAAESKLDPGRSAPGWPQGDRVDGALPALLASRLGAGCRMPWRWAWEQTDLRPVPSLPLSPPPTRMFVLPGAVDSQGCQPGSRLHPAQLRICSCVGLGSAAPSQAWGAQHGQALHHHVKFCPEHSGN